MNTKEKTSLNLILSDAHRDFEKGLRARALFKINDREMSEDLVQDTFMKTWKHLLNGGKIHMMKAFLYHVLNHLIIDEYRRRKTSSLDDLLEKGIEIGMDDTEHLFNTFDGKMLAVLTKSLPKKYREVINLRFDKGLSLEEISVLTGETKNTIAVQLHRGIKKLKLLYDAKM